MSDTDPTVMLRAWIFCAFHPCKKCYKLKVYLCQLIFFCKSYVLTYFIILDPQQIKVAPMGSSKFFSKHFLLEKVQFLYLIYYSAKISALFGLTTLSVMLCHTPHNSVGSCCHSYVFNIFTSKY
jgi:hypothetical protein